MTSLQEQNWDLFSRRMGKHIKEYVLPQYGDEGEDMASEYTVEDCVTQVKKYMGRFGRNARPGQEELDLLKAAHYLQKAWKLQQGQ